MQRCRVNSTEQRHTIHINRNIWAMVHYTCQKRPIYTKRTLQKRPTDCMRRCRVYLTTEQRHTIHINTDIWAMVHHTRQKRPIYTKRTLQKRPTYSKLRCWVYSTTEQRNTNDVNKDIWAMVHHTCQKRPIYTKIKPYKRDLLTLNCGVESIQQLSNATPTMSKLTNIHEKNHTKETHEYIKNLTQETF